MNFIRFSHLLLISFILIVVLKDSVGQSKLELEMINEDGNEMSLAQFEGCYIFLAFWSKNCAPCIRSFQKNRELRDELVNQGAVIINASIDSREDWNKALLRYNPNGLNVYLKNFEKAQDDFEIFNLPVYVTIDYDGNLVEYSRQQRGDILEFADKFAKR